MLYRIGIIFEAKQQISFADLHVIPDCLSACLQSLFLHILMNWHSNMILKKWAIWYLLTKILLPSCPETILLPDALQYSLSIFLTAAVPPEHYAHVFHYIQSGLNEEADRWRTGKPSPLFQNDWNKFPQQMKYFCLNRIKSDSVVMENIFSFCLHQLYQIAILPSIFHQAVQIVNRNPEYKPSIGHAFIVNDCMMLQTRRHYRHVSVLQRIFFFSISRDTSPSRKNKSHSNHGYGWQPFHMLIFIIINFEVSWNHILPCIKLGV